MKNNLFWKEIKINSSVKFIFYVLYVFKINKKN